MVWGFDRADAVASLVVVAPGGHVEGGGAACSAYRAAHPARGHPGGHRHGGGAPAPDGTARGAVGPRPARLDPHLVPARSSPAHVVVATPECYDRWKPARCSTTCRSACPGTSTSAHSTLQFQVAGAHRARAQRARLTGAQRAGREGGSRPATSSTCSVIGKMSKAQAR